MKKKCGQKAKGNAKKPGKGEGNRQSEAAKPPRAPATRYKKR